MKLNFNFSGKTLLKDWWKTVRDNFTTIQTDHNTLSDKLDTEITQRTNADVGLSDQITAEKKARESTDNTLQGNIDAEAKNRRVGDSELREQILTEQTNRTNADDILNGEKADKTDLYGKETDVVHTITHSLEKSDLSIDINTSYGDGTITINSLAVQTKIFLDGNSAIQTEPISASFSAEKGEEGEKWVNLLYDQYTGKLGLEVTEQPEAGNVAKIAVTYMKAEVAEMYAGQLKFDGIKDLRALKTDNKNSFLAAVNEIATKLTTEISDRQAADDELKAKFTDLKTVAFTGSYTDLSNKPTTATTSTSGFMSAADKTKLNGIATGANNYTHPSTHPASMIVQDSTHRFVSDNEISDWDNKLDANFVSNGYAGIDEVTTTLSDMWSDRVAPPTTITISSSTSKHMLTADYYCSGTNDQTVINNAISALPSTGGKIVLLEGTYNISGQINVNKPNVTICGMGNSTVLNCKQGIWGIAATQPNFTVANLKMTFDTYNSTSICIYASGSRCKFENLDLSNAVYGINCGGGHSIIHNVTATDNNINIHLGSAYNIVSDCYSEDAKETGIRVEGICNIVTGCHISDAGTYGILVTSGGGSKVADNIIIRDSYSDSQYSIYVTSSAYNSCTDNVMIGKNYTNVGGTTNSFISNKYS